MSCYWDLTQKKETTCSAGLLAMVLWDACQWFEGKAINFKADPKWLKPVVIKCEHLINRNSVSSQRCPPHPSPAPRPRYHTSVEIWKLLKTSRIDWAFADWMHCSKVTHSMHSYPITFQWCQEYSPMSNKHNGRRMTGCKRKKDIEKNTPALTTHRPLSLHFQVFPRKGNFTAVYGTNLLGGYILLM